MIFLWERCCTASCLWKSYNIFMKNNTYTNFNEEKVDEDIVMGVPVNLAPGQLANPCFPQLPPNFVGIHPQTYHHNQNAALHQINALPGIPPSVGANQQPFPQLQSQMFNYCKPINIRCPCCNVQVNTIVNNESGNAVYFWAFTIFCCISPLCACFPFATDKCMDNNHYCPNCGFNILRKHRPFFDCF